LSGEYLEQDKGSEKLFEHAKTLIANLFPVLLHPHRRISSFMEQKLVDPTARFAVFEVLAVLPRFYLRQISDWLDENLNLLFPQDGM